MDMASPIFFNYNTDPSAFHHPGQKLNDDQIVAEKNLDPNAPLGERLLVNHRRLIGILMPFVAFQVSIGAIILVYQVGLISCTMVGMLALKPSVRGFGYLWTPSLEILKPFRGSIIPILT